MANKIPTKRSFFDSISNRTAYLIFAAIVFLLYIQSVKFEFTHYDDIGLIRAKELNLSNIKEIFSNGVFHFTGEVPASEDIYYRPMQNIFYAFGNTIGGHTPAIHHFLSLVLHFICGCLLYRFFQITGTRKIVNFLFTILFLVHPLLVQAVVWIPGVGELLITAFLISSFIFLNTYLSSERNNLIPFIISLILFFCALLSKESAIGYIPLAIFYGIVFHKKFNRKRIYYYSAGLILLSVLWFLIRQSQVGKYSTISATSVFHSFIDNGKLLFFYIEKMFLPFSLGPLSVLADANFIAGLVIVILLIITGIVIKGKRNYTLIIFGLLWYLFFLLPTLFLSDESRVFYSYNHRMYLPMIGLIIVLIEIFRLNDLKIKQSYIVSSFSILILICFAASFSYSNSFENKFTFFERAVKVSPHSGRELEKLATYYFEEKECDKALEYFQKAIESNPKNHGYYGWVANTYYSCIGDVSKALEWYNKAMQVDSTSKIAANTAISLGNIYNSSPKNISLAVYWFRKAIMLDSTIAYPYETLANIYYPINADSAKTWFRRLVVIDTNSSVGWNGLGLIDYQNANYIGAVQDFTHALKINPSEPELYKNVMLAYMHLNNLEKTKIYAQAYTEHGGTVPDDVADYIKHQ